MGLYFYKFLLLFNPLIWDWTNKTDKANVSSNRPVNLNCYPAEPFIKSHNQATCLAWGRHQPERLVTGPHSFSLGVTGEGGGAKESDPHIYLELLTLRGKGPLHEAPAPPDRAASQTHVRIKGAWPDGDQILSRLGSEYCQLYFTMSLPKIPKNIQQNILKLFP